jgi:peptide/nickel transport system substrate-binding protein
MGFYLRLASLLLALGLGNGAFAQQGGGTAVIAVVGDPGQLNPAISTAGPLHAVADSMFNGLITLDRDGNAQPDLARAWSVSEDGLEVRFDLTPGVTWHDGQPFTSADVAFTFEEGLFKYHARARAGPAPAWRRRSSRSRRPTPRP